MKRKQTLLLFLFILFIGGFTFKVFPDPYYHGENVTFFEWVYREIDELMHGEKK